MCHKKSWRVRIVLVCENLEQTKDGGRRARHIFIYEIEVPLWQSRGRKIFKHKNTYDLVFKKVGGFA